MPKKNLKPELVQALEDCYLDNPESIPNALSSKARYFACVGYPGDSLPDNYRMQLTLQGLKWCESPLHDKDVDSTGTPKKVHIHFIFAWDNTTTFNSFCELVVSILHGSRCISLSNPSGYYRYLTHEDNPEKFHYNKKDIKPFAGFNIDEYVSISKFTERQIRIQCEEFIEDNQITEYNDFTKQLRLAELWDLYDYACTHTMHFNAKITSLRHGLCKKVVTIVEEVSND